MSNQYFRQDGPDLRAPTIEFNTPASCSHSRFKSSLPLGEFDLKSSTKMNY